MLYIKYLPRIATFYEQETSLYSCEKPMEVYLVQKSGPPVAINLSWISQDISYYTVLSLLDQAYPELGSFVAFAACSMLSGRVWGES